MSSLQERMDQLGVQLPEAPVPVGSYLPAVKVGDLVYTSGQLPTVGGKLVTGKLGAEVSIEQGVQAAKAAVLNALAQVAAQAGDLANVVRIVRVGVFVNSAAGFTDQPKVANGASDFLVALFGENGRHVRAAVGCNELPLNAAVEVELIAQVRD